MRLKNILITIVALLIGAVGYIAVAQPTCPRCYANQEPEEGRGLTQENPPRRTLNIYIEYLY